uniref:Death domain-containing protein n=1 Tax=Amphimedon queenslandica TaxID=400682 RepID=A0A1X7V4W4_AMPQE
MVNNYILFNLLDKSTLNSTKVIIGGVYYIFIQLIGYILDLIFISPNLVTGIIMIVSNITFISAVTLWLKSLPAPTDDYDKKYMEKVDEKVETKLKIISCMTVGPPTVGKTTLREQLRNNKQKKDCKRPLSTQVADKIKKFQFTAGNNKWNHMTSDEELTGFVKGLEKEQTSLVAIVFASLFFIAPTWMAIVVFCIKENENENLSHLKFFKYLILTVSCQVLFMMVLCDNPIPPHIYKNITIEFVRNTISKKIFKKTPPIYSDTLLVHFRDSGGQPEFHEVIPALMPQSTLYLIMFNLNEDLEKEYNVTYKASEEDTSARYKSSFTVKETILQILASIQSLHNYEKPGITSSALIIGTHKDKIQGTRQLQQIQQELEKEIKGTDWYTSDAIATTPNGDLILPIDTYNHNDVETVKDMIKQSTATRSYKVPVTFIALYFTIEKLNKPVMSFKEFKNHARDCNIKYEVELNRVCQYLQDTMGAIQYFKNIPEMKDIVITDPQILFDLVNELILCTFTFKNIRTMDSRNQAERFRFSGRFTKQVLQECDIIKRGLLTADQVIPILIHLSIIAPVGINSKGYEEYFLPYVLVHAPVSVPASMLTVATGYSPLLVTFKCGYTPRGVFSCLISSILCCKGQWVLSSDKIYRNQVMFHLTEHGHYVILKNCIKHLQVTITVCHGSTISDVPFPKIRGFLSQHLSIIITKLRYSASKVGHSFGFYCTLEDHATSDPHIAQCISNVQNPHIKCTIGPSPMTASLTPEQAIWFKDDYNSKRTTFDITHLSMVLQFLTDNHYDATAWRRLGLALGIYQLTLNKIESDARGKTEDCLIECLSAWLRQEDNVKESGIPNWYTLEKALDSIRQR